MASNKLRCLFPVIVWIKWEAGFEKCFITLTPYIHTVYHKPLQVFTSPPATKAPARLARGAREHAEPRGTRGTVNAHHGSCFKVMNSNKSSTGCLLRDKKSIWPPGCTSFSHAVSQAWLSGNVPFNITRGLTQPNSQVTYAVASPRKLSAPRRHLGAQRHFHMSLLPPGRHRPQQRFERWRFLLLPENWGEKPRWVHEVAEGVLTAQLPVIRSRFLTFPSHASLKRALY